MAKKTDSEIQVFDLDALVYDELGFFNKKLSTKEINRYIYFQESGHPINGENEEVINGCIGKYGMNSIFVYYNNINPELSQTLDIDTLEQIDEIGGIKIVYAIECSISAEILQKRNIVFKQIPYETGGGK